MLSPTDCCGGKPVHVIVTARLALVAVILAIAFHTTAQGAVSLINVSPSTIGLGGGVPLTITGRDFPTSAAQLELLSVDVGTSDGRTSMPCPLRMNAGSATRLVCDQVPPSRDVFETLPRTSTVMQLRVTHNFVTVSLPLTFDPSMTDIIGVLPVTAKPTDSLSFRVVNRTTGDPSAYKATLGNSTCSLVQRYGLDYYASITPNAEMTVTCNILAVPSGMYNFSIVSSGAAGKLGAAISLKLEERLLYQMDDFGQAFSTYIHPTISSIAPSAFGIGGGVMLTISGSGFASPPSANVVTVGSGLLCQVVAATFSTIHCLTRAGSTSPSARGGGGILKKSFASGFTAPVTLGQLEGNADYTADTPTVTTIHTTGLAVRSFPNVGAPMAESLQGYFVPTVTGSYTFFCSASDFVDVRISTGNMSDVVSMSLCSSSGATNSFVSRYTSAANGETPVGEPIELQAGQAYRIRVNYGASNPSSHYSVSASIAPRSSAAFNSSQPPFLTVPHTIKIISLPSNASQFTASYFIYYGAGRVFIPGVPLRGNCTDVPIAARLMTAFPSFIVEEQVTQTASGCEWTLAFHKPQGPVEGIRVESAILRVPIEGRLDPFHDPLPIRLFEAAVPSSSLFPVRVRANGLAAFSSTTVPPVVTFTNEASPQITSVEPTTVFRNTASPIAVLLRGRNLYSNTTPTVILTNLDSGSEFGCTSVETFLTADLLICQISDIPTGSHRLNVRYPTAGDIPNSTVYIHHQFSVSSVSPSLAGRYGGILVTVGGRSFPEKPENLIIRVAGVLCPIVRIIGRTSVICRAPQLPENVTVTPIVAPSTYELTVEAFVRSSNATNFSRQLQSRGCGENTVCTPMRFQYVLSGEPQISSISPTTGIGGASTRLTINGQNLAGTTVQLCHTNGCVHCYAVQSNSTQMVCIVRPLAPLRYNVTAFSQTLGASNNNLTFQSFFSISDINPIYGSQLGGASVTIRGTGFTSQVQVQLGDLDCEVESVTGSQIICVAPGSQLLDTPMRVDVSIPNGGPHASCLRRQGCWWAYNSSTIKPFVSAVVPRSGQAEYITLTGVNFPPSADNVTVTVGPTFCRIDRYRLDVDSGTHIFSCRIAQITAAGIVRTRVHVAPFGYVRADRDSLFDFTFTLALHTAYPLIGSVAGGRVVTLVGHGFGSNSIVTVAGMPCNIDPQLFPGTMINGTVIKCETSSLSVLEDLSGPVVVRLGENNVVSCCTFQYAIRKTLRINSITPQSGVEGDQVNITGPNFQIQDPAANGNASVNGEPANNILSISIAGTEVNGMYQIESSIVNITIPRLPAVQAPIVARSVYGKAWNTRSQNLQVHPTLININSTSNSLVALSSAGGGHNITVYGSRFSTKPSDQVVVSICSVQCKLTSLSYNKVECESPPQINQQSIGTWPYLLPRYQTWIRLLAYSDAAAIAPMLDGSIETHSTLRRGIGTGLAVTLAFGEYVYAYLYRIEVFPVSGQQHLLNGAIWEVSNDALSWTTVGAIRSGLLAWNVLELNAYTNARFIRLTAASTVKAFSINEIRVLGTLGAPTGSEICPLVVAITAVGSSTMSTCTEKPVQCQQLVDNIRYSDIKTAIVNKISPPYGATTGGTLVTMTGSNFPSATPQLMQITVDGVPCTTNFVSALSITCLTGPKINPLARSETKILIEGSGYAVIDAHPFFYGDPWSQAATWGGNAMPAAGDVVVIPSGTVVVLDISPPPLTALIIQGVLHVATTFEGELSANYILVDGGSLIAGTSDQGLSRRFNITLLKTPDSEALPLFGETVLAVDNGTLSLATDFAVTMRTTLFSTVNAGDSSITVNAALSNLWNVGDRIALITTTNDFEQSEPHTIAEVTASGGRTTFRLTEPVQYTHHSATDSIDAALALDLRCVVVRLSHPIIVQGPADATSTGHGGHIMIRGKSKVHISDVEFRDLGQRGLMDRHPLLLDNTGVMLGNSIRSSSIHRSVNRGLVLKGSVSHLTIQSNVVFDTEGHGIALHGARHNVLATNFVAKSKPTSGLDEITANYHFTHPSNTITSNTAAGAHHSGFWFNFASSDPLSGSQCPDQGTMGTVSNNVAYSNGYYGMWIYPQHVPRTIECGGINDATNPIRTTTITGLFSYHNKRVGAVLGVVSNYLLSGCRFAGNGDAGFAAVDTLGMTSTLTTSYIIAHTSLSTTFLAPISVSRGISGVRTPRSDGLRITNSTWVGYREVLGSYPRYAIRTCFDCTRSLGGYTTAVSTAQFINTTDRIAFDGNFNDMIIDLDGTMTSSLTPTQAPFTVLPRYDHIQNLPGCNVPVSTFMKVQSNTGLRSFICNASYSFHRVWITSVQPLNLTGFNISTTSAYGSQHWRYLGHAESPGYVVILPSGTLGALNQDVSWLNFSTTSTTGEDWSRLRVEASYAIPLKSPTLDVAFRYNSLFVRIDSFARSYIRTLPDLSNRTLLPQAPGAPVLPTLYTVKYNANITGTPTHCFMDLSNKLFTLRFTGRSSSSETVDLSSILCPSTGCIFMQPPVDPPQTYTWDDPRAWPNGVQPANGADVIIPPGLTLQLAGDTPRLRSLVIQGKLEVIRAVTSRIRANYLVVYGGSLIAGSNTSAPYEGLLEITLLTTPTSGFVRPEQKGISEDLILTPGTFVSFGEVRVIGMPKSVQWTKLVETKPPGSSNIKVADVVDWAAGDEIIITSSGYEMREIEEHVFNGYPTTSADGRTFITANGLQHEHLGLTADVSETIQLTLAAEAAVLSRRIKIQGEISSTADPLANPGCYVLFSEYGADPAFAARGDLYNTEIRYCGRTNSTWGALNVKNVRRNGMRFGQNSVHHSLSAALSMNATTGVSFTRNIFYSTRGSTVTVGASSGNTFTQNLAAGTRYPWHVWNDTNHEFNGTLCSFDSRFGINAWSGNIAAGSESEGFCIQLPPDCANTGDAPYTVVNNEAHSNVIGWFNGRHTHLAEWIHGNLQCHQSKHQHVSDHQPQQPHWTLRSWRGKWELNDH